MDKSMKITNEIYKNNKTIELELINFQSDKECEYFFVKESKDKEAFERFKIKESERTKKHTGTTYNIIESNIDPTQPYTKKLHYCIHCLKKYQTYIKNFTKFNKRKKNAWFETTVPDRERSGGKYSRSRGKYSHSRGKYSRSSGKYSRIKKTRTNSGQ